MLLHTGVLTRGAKTVQDKKLSRDAAERAQSRGSAEQVSTNVPTDVETDAETDSGQHLMPKLLAVAAVITG